MAVIKRGVIRNNKGWELVEPGRKAVMDGIHYFIQLADPTAICTSGDLSDLIQIALSVGRQSALQGDHEIRIATDFPLSARGVKIHLIIPRGTDSLYRLDESAGFNHLTRNNHRP